MGITFIKIAAFLKIFIGGYMLGYSFGPKGDSSDLLIGLIVIFLGWLELEAVVYLESGDIK